MRPSLSQGIKPGIEPGILDSQPELLEADASRIKNNRRLLRLQRDVYAFNARNGEQDTAHRLDATLTTHATHTHHDLLHCQTPNENFCCRKTSENSLAGKGALK